MAEDQTPLGGEDQTRADDSAKRTNPALVAAERRKKDRYRKIPLLPEVRHFKATGLEVRSNAKTDEIVISGSPIVYGADYTVTDMFGQFTERMMPGVAKDVLANLPDVRFLFNHDGLPLARSTAGTLALQDSENELRFTACLDARQQLANDLAIAIQRGDVSQMSCGFVVARDEWDEDMEDRSIHSLADLLDVSAVTYPASPTTSIEVGQRMMLAAPVESRARLRRAVADVAAGKTLSPDRMEAFRALAADLDPGDDTQTPAGTGRLGSPDGDGKTWSDPGSASLGDGTEGQGTTGGTGMSNAQDGTGSRAAPATAAERREQSMSYDDRQSAVFQAIRSQYGQTDDGFDIWINDMGDDWVVWQDYQANTLLRCSYVIDADGNVTLGDSQPVVQHTIYKAVEQASRTTQRRVRRALRGI